MPVVLRHARCLVAITACSGDPGRGEAGSTEAEASSGVAATGAAGSSGGVEATDPSGSSGEPCTAEVPGPPGRMSYPFTLGGQAGWSHDDGFPAGWFHTFDALDVGGPEDAPHKVHVLLPREYEACGAGYPVVYMNDGDTSFWPGGAGDKSWDVAGALAGLYAEGAVPQVIVVAIVPNDREYEYSHTPWTDGVVCCGVEQYTAYVADRVRGFVDAHYNTRGGPANTAIVGSSRGGLAAFYLAHRRPEVFGRAGCLSPSFWLGLDPVYGGGFTGGPLADSALVQMFDGVLADPQVRPRLWIDWGLVRTGGFHNAVIEAAATARGREMVLLLQETYGYSQAELRWLEDPLGEHDEITWGRHFPAVMKTLMGGV